jgi:membrane protease YdiL (CAAX protease family)
VGTEPFGGILLSLTLATATGLLAAFQAPRSAAALRLQAPSSWRAGAALALAALSVDGALDSLRALVPWWPATRTWPEPGPLDVLLGVALAPLAEELFFRGALQTAVSRRWGRWPAILASDLAFSLWHEDLSRGHVLFLAGLAYAWTAEASGSVGPALVAHALNNLLALLLGETLAVPTSVHLVTLGLCSLALGAAVVAARRAAPPLCADRAQGHS